MPTISPGSIHDDYELGPELGSGAFAVVREGRCRKTGKKVAIKVVPLTKQTRESLRHEVAILQRVSMHKRIARLEAFYETPTHAQIVMEYVSGGELFDHLVEHGAYSEREAALLLQDVCGAVALLHAQGVCHADIKPENMLLAEDGHVKLVDFGLSCDVFDPKLSSRSLGTLAYWPPEILRGLGGPGLAMDMWALGCVLYILLEGVHPFDATGTATEHELKASVCRDEPAFDEWHASAEAKSLIKALLKKDPNERLTIEELLQHPWMLNGPSEASTFSGIALRRREHKLRIFRERSAKLRAACFAVILQQLAAATSDGAAEEMQIRRHDSSRASMIEHDVLARAFYTFDAEGKGFISEADLKRVLASFGRGQTDTRDWLEAAAENDREGTRVAYGSYIRLMSNTVQQRVPRGGFVFEQGAPVRYFYVLLSGELEVVRHGTHGLEVLNAIHAGEYFGENSLLSGKPTRSVGVRSATDSVILKLSKEDFEAGFGAPSGADDDDSLRTRLLSFIQMVSPDKQRIALEYGSPVFSEGNPADSFYILERGSLAVAGERGSAAHQDGHPLGKIHEGEGFGEGSLMRGMPTRSKTVTCDAPVCHITSVRAADFLRLLEKSAVVRASFERLAATRDAHNRAVQSEHRGDSGGGDPQEEGGAHNARKGARAM